jgi:hypothetical protein
LRAAPCATSDRIDPEISENLANLAGAYRRQAELLKAARKKRGKKR